MYGYVRPLKGELKVSEYESYHSLYCALCRELSRRGGFFARFVVNYDFTFLAMLLSREETICREWTRCPARLGRRRACVCADASLSRAADESLVLAWWKLADSIADSSFFKSLPYRAARLLLRPAYRKAARAQPEFAETVRRSLGELGELERGGCDSLDAAADKFAVILRAAAESEPEEKRRRVLRSLLYQLGRFVYILDAVDDFDEDRKHGAYNPLRARYSDRALTEDDKQALRQTLCQTQSSIAAAYALLDENAWQSVLSNVIYYGLPWASEAVLDGSWNRKQQDRRAHERPL